MDFSIWNFLAWLAIVLFGMEVLEDTIKSVSAESLKKWLKTFANTPLKAIFSGFGITAILQSSSVVSLIILAFVWAGLLSLPNAIWAIIWANVWSTILGVIVLGIWFSFNISSFALTMIAVGGLVNKFFHNIILKNIGKIVLSFWFLFYWLGILRDAVDVFSSSIDLAQYSYIWWGWWFLIGIVVTAILHSSGAMSIITLAALHGGIIDFPQGMMIIAGANIGTCVTAIWWAMWWSAQKKQVAAAHVIFNVISGVLVLIFGQPLTWIFQELFSFPGQAVTALAIFQLIYNIIWAILFYPFIYPLSKFLQRRIHEEKPDYTLGVSTLELTDIDIAIPVLQNDVIMLLKKIFKFNVHHLRIDQKKLLQKDISFDTKVSLEYILNHEALSEDYHVMKVIEESILGFILKAMHQPTISKESLKKLQDLYEATERMIYAAKAWKDIENNTIALFQSDNIFIKNRLQELKKHMVELYVTIADIIDNTDVYKKYDTVVNIINTIKSDNIIFVQKISEYIMNNNLDQQLLTSLFHVSQANERSNDAIVDALKKIFVQEDQRKYM